jgi:hypothetical protein
VDFGGYRRMGASYLADKDAWCIWKHPDCDYCDCWNGDSLYRSFSLARRTVGTIRAAGHKRAGRQVEVFDDHCRDARRLLRRV